MNRRGIAFGLAALLCLAIFLPPLHGQKAEMFAAFKGGAGVLAADAVKLPFTIMGSHIMFVTVRLNGKSQRHYFVFDTGGVTILDTALAAEYGLETTPIKKDTAITNLARMDLEGVTVTDFRPFVLDFAGKFRDLGRRAGMRLEGMVGCDLLRFFRVAIDYRGDHLLLTRGESPLSATGKNQDLLPMELMLPYHPCVQVEFADRFRLPGRIDTGLHYAIVLPLDQMEKLTADEKATLIQSRGNFAKWPDTTTPHNFLYRFAKIRIGKFLLNNQAVLFAELPAALGTDYALLGKHFLENYVTTLDFGRKQVMLEKLPKESDYALDDSAGLHLAREKGRVKVIGVWQGSPADRAGIAPGQAVLEINGKEAAELDNGALLRILMDRKIRELILVLATEGKPRRVVLKKEDLFLKSPAK